MYVVTPKNKTAQKKFEREIKKTGTIAVDYKAAESGQVTGLSSVTEEEIIPAPVPKKKAKSSAKSAQRSQRRTRYPQSANDGDSRRASWARFLPAGTESGFIIQVLDQLAGVDPD